MNKKSALKEVKTVSLALEITPRALDKIKSLLSEEADALCFRAQVEGGGCQGLRYVFSLDEAQEHDWRHHVDGVEVVVDDISYAYLEGASIDYEISALGEQFTVHNPKELSRCSCGASFHADVN